MLQHVQFKQVLMPRRNRKAQSLRQRLYKQSNKANQKPFEEVAGGPSFAYKTMKNNQFIVFFSEERITLNNVRFKCDRIMVQANDGKPIINHWAKMQDIKNQLFGEDFIGIEFYPTESELIDDANIYWMYIVSPNLLSVTK